MRTEIPCWDKITLNQEKKQKNSNGSQTARMANFLVKVKPELPLSSLNADTNHHFLYHIPQQQSSAAQTRVAGLFFTRYSVKK